MIIAEFIKDISSEVAPSDVQSRYKYTLGISLSREGVDISIAEKNQPFRVSSLRDWSGDKPHENKHEFLLDPDEISLKRYPSTILYHDKNHTQFISGNRALRDHPGYGISINIVELIYDFLDGRTSHHTGYEDLNVQKVLIDFLFSLMRQAFKMLYFHCGPSNTSEAQFNISEFAGSCRYCVKGPNDEYYKSLFRYCFLEAELMDQSDPKGRLIFASSSESLGQYILSSRDSLKTKTVICDFSYDYISLAYVDPKSTQSTSAVYGFTIANEYVFSSWRPFEKYLRNVVTDEVVYEDYLNRFKRSFQSDFNLDEDLKNNAFIPFINGLFDTLLKLYNIEDSFARVVYSGDLTLFPEFAINFNEYERNQTMDDSVIDIQWWNKKHYCLSEGCVVHALLIRDIQMPNKMNVIDDNTPRSSPLDLEDKPATPEKYDYVVGIDFGTTYSGASYVSTKKYSHITPFTQWDLGTEEKTCTILLFDDAKKKLKQYWGEKAKRYLKRGMFTVEKFKLLLADASDENYYGKGNQAVGEAAKVVQDTTLNVSQLIAEYLSRISSHVVKKLNAIDKRSPKPLRIKYVLTVPCMWNLKAKSTMLEAAVFAGLAKYPEDITIITEPEAAAICYASILQKLSPKRANFIVCDAGGGTVDLVTFQVEHMEINNKSVSTYKQIGEGIGNVRGSDKLNARFFDFILEDFSVDFNKRQTLLIDLLDQFEQKKRGFDLGVENMSFPIPKQCIESVNKIANFVSKGEIVDNHYVIQSADIKEMFDHVVTNAIDILEKEYQKTAKDPSTKVSAVLMVGGLCFSPYFRKAVKQWCDTKGIRLPTDGLNCMTAISRGAADYGIDPRLITKRNAGQTYSLLCKSESVELLKHFISEGEAIHVTKDLFSKIITITQPTNLVIAIFSPKSGVAKEDNIYDKEKYDKVLETRVEIPFNNQNGKPTRIRISIQFTVSNVVCHIETRGQGSTEIALPENGTHMWYNLKYPPIGYSVDAIKASLAFTYSSKNS